jgi:hypothetical protein
MVRSSSIASFDRVLPLTRFRSPQLPGGFGSVARSMPLGLRFGRPGPPLSRVISSRSVATNRRNLNNQALQFGMGQVVKIIGR